jgi:NADH-quinone oxidoreductase subunit A
MLSEYLPILLFLGISTILGGVLITVGSVLSPSNPNSEKSSPYECGFEAFEDTRGQFDVRFYLVAIMFIIFDLEIAFFVPWAVALDELGMQGFIAMSIFVLLLIVGFIVDWRRGALEWE